MSKYKNSKRFISLMLTICFLLSSVSLVYASVWVEPVYTTGYKTDFENVSVTDGKIIENGKEMFLNVSEIDDGSNKYIKGTNSNSFVFRATEVIDGNTDVMVLDFDAYFAVDESFELAITHSSRTHYILKFDRTRGLVADTDNSDKDGDEYNITEIDTPCLSSAEVSVGWHNLKIIMDYDTNGPGRTYSVIFDNKLVENALYLHCKPHRNSGKGIKITSTSGVDNLSFYVNKFTDDNELPQPYGVSFKTQPKLGESTIGSAAWHTIAEPVSGYEKNYSYYISEGTEIDGKYSEITAASSSEGLVLESDGGLSILGEYDGRYLKIAANSQLKSGDVVTAASGVSYSAPVQITCDKFNLSLGDGVSDSRFKLKSKLDGDNIEWSVSEDSSDYVSLLGDVITVKAKPPAEKKIYLTAKNPVSGAIHMQLLEFIDSSSDKSEELSTWVYPVIFKANVQRENGKCIMIGGKSFNIADDRIEGVAVDSSFDFKLVFDNDKYYAFADDKLISSSDAVGIKPLKPDNGNTASFNSYYAGSPLAADGSFIKAELPATVGEGTIITMDNSYWEFYNESGVYPASYTMEWYVDGILDSSDDKTDNKYEVPYGKERLYCKIKGGGKEISTNEANIGSQYTLITTSDGSFTLNLNPGIDRKIYAFIISDDGDVIYADMETKLLGMRGKLSNGEDYTLYFADKTKLSLRGMPVNINIDDDDATSDGSYIMLSYTPYINYLIRKGLNGETNPAAGFEKAHSLAEFKDLLMASDGGDISDVILDIYTTSDSADTYRAMTELGGGNYNLTSASVDGLSENAFYHKPYELFSNPSCFDYANFANLSCDIMKTTPEHSSFSLSDASDIYTLLKSVSDKDKVSKLIGKDIKYYPAAVNLTCIIEKASADEAALTDLMTSLTKVGLKSDFISPLKLADSYSLIMSAIKAADGIKTVTDSLREKIILSEVKNGYNYKNIKPFLELIGSSIYNTAGEAGQNYAALSVHKKDYSNISALKSAVEYAVLNPPQQGGGDMGGSGGGGGGGSIKPPVIQSGALTPSEPDTAPITPIIPNSVFNDIAPDHWAYDYILAMNERGIITGYDGMCRPEDNITRAEYAKVICAAFGIETIFDDSFADVSSGDWFAPYIGGAKKAGIVVGTGQLFEPNSTITREDAAVMLWRLLQTKGHSKTNAENIFVDLDFSDYSIESVSELASLGIINGITSDTFAPKTFITRAQAAKLIHFAMNLGGDR